MLPRVSDSQASAGNEAPAEADSKYRPIFDISGIDLNAVATTRDRVEQFIPHRGVMSLLDHVIWEHPTRLQGVAVKTIRPDEFWVPGHFPGHPMFPGVMMIETAAQFAAYLFKSRVSPGPSLVVFLRIEDVAFRNMVQPGDKFLILCDEIKIGRRRFTTSAQGLVGDKIAFDGKLSGMIR